MTLSEKGRCTCPLSGILSLLDSAVLSRNEMLANMAIESESEFREKEFCSVPVELISAYSPEKDLIYDQTLLCMSRLNQKGFGKNWLQTRWPSKSICLIPTSIKAQHGAPLEMRSRVVVDSFKKAFVTGLQTFQLLPPSDKSYSMGCRCWIIYLLGFLIAEISCTLSIWTHFSWTKYFAVGNHQARHRYQAKMMWCNNQICWMQVLFHNQFGPCAKIQSF